MPQIPLFVSSSQASTVQNGSCEVAFTPPLHVPEGATDATIHLAHATIPFTEPNVSAALKNNKLVVALPTADGSGSVPEFTSARNGQGCRTCTSAGASISRRRASGSRR